MGNVRKIGFALLLLASSCAYCRDVTHKDETRCKVQALITDCGSKAIMSIIGAIGPEIVAALVNGNYSTILDQVTQTLIQRGVPDALHVVACAVQHFDGSMMPALAKGAPFPNGNAVVMHTHAQLWLNRYGHAKPSSRLHPSAFDGIVAEAVRETDTELAADLEPVSLAGILPAPVDLQEMDRLIAAVVRAQKSNLLWRPGNR